jgi:hypothetical protein
MPPATGSILARALTTPNGGAVSRTAHPVDFRVVTSNNDLGSDAVATKVVGGGSSAVAASAHAACARFRQTDPLITGRTRRGLAKELGFHDEFGGIPEAR